MTDDLAGFAAYWGAGNLTRWDASAVRDVEMPAASKRFLVDIGLPSPGRDIHGWEFEWDPALQYFDVDRKLRLLGRNLGFHPILIDESRGGCIIWDATKDGYERYVNASVEQFAESLIELDKRRLRALQSIDNGDPYDAVAVARILVALRRKLMRIDRTALADRGNLWSTVIEDGRRELGWR